MFSLIPRDMGFFNLFEEAADAVHRTAEAYAHLAQNYGQKDQSIARIRQLEHDGDNIAHRTLEKLDQTFLVPFDREDIQALMMGMDDIIDKIDAASKRLNLYLIDEPTDWFVRQTDVLVQATALLAQAIRGLRNLKKSGAIQAQLVEIHRLENVGDENNHAAVAELFNNSADPILVMKWKEIYDMTERAIDACEDVANVIGAIILKNS
jgi:uncharacterized protein